MCAGASFIPGGGDRKAEGGHKFGVFELWPGAIMAAAKKAREERRWTGGQGVSEFSKPGNVLVF